MLILQNNTIKHLRVTVGGSFIFSNKEANTLGD